MANRSIHRRGMRSGRFERLTPRYGPAPCPEEERPAPMLGTSAAKLFPLPIGRAGRVFQGTP